MLELQVISHIQCSEKIIQHFCENDVRLKICIKRLSTFFFFRLCILSLWVASSLFFFIFHFYRALFALCNRNVYIYCSAMAIIIIIIIFAHRALLNGYNILRLKKISILHTINSNTPWKIISDRFAICSYLVELVQLECMRPTAQNFQIANRCDFFVCDLLGNYVHYITWAFEAGASERGGKQTRNKENDHCYTIFAMCQQRASESFPTPNNRKHESKINWIWPNWIQNLDRKFSIARNIGRNFNYLLELECRPFRFQIDSILIRICRHAVCSTFITIAFENSIY